MDEIIDRYTKKTGKSWAQQSRELGYEPNAVSRWHKGVMPRLDRADEIAKYYRCKFEDLYRGRAR